MKTAIYPGTFDPITLGHIDVIKKSLKIFDKLVVATTNNINKKYYFSIDERISIIKNSLFLFASFLRHQLKRLSNLETSVLVPKGFQTSAIQKFEWQR